MRARAAAVCDQPAAGSSHLLESQLRLIWWPLVCGCICRRRLLRRKRGQPLLARPRQATRLALLLLRCRRHPCYRVDGGGHGGISRSLCGRCHRSQTRGWRCRGGGGGARREQAGNERGVGRHEAASAQRGQASEAHRASRAQPPAAGRPRSHRQQPSAGAWGPAAAAHPCRRQLLPPPAAPTWRGQARASAAPTPLAPARRKTRSTAVQRELEPMAAALRKGRKMTPRPPAPHQQQAGEAAPQQAAPPPPLPPAACGAGPGTALAPTPHETARRATAPRRAPRPQVTCSQLAAGAPRGGRPRLRASWPLLRGGCHTRATVPRAPATAAGAATAKPRHSRQLLHGSPAEGWALAPAAPPLTRTPAEAAAQGRCA